jgi:Flp pilus assembly secretin CpaC
LFQFTYLDKRRLGFSGKTSLAKENAMWKAIFILLLLCVAGVGLCQEQWATPQKPVVGIQPPAAVTNNKMDERTFHLTQAVAHLEAAGLDEEAKKIHQMIENDESPTVLVQITLLEVSLEKLKKLGFEYAKIASNNLAEPENTTPENSIKKEALLHSGFMVLKADDAYFSVMKALVHDKLAKTLTSPQIITRSGQAASIRIGGTPGPVAIKPGASKEESQKINTAIEKFSKQFVGINIDVNPVVLNDKTIHLAIKGGHSELYEEHGTKIAGTTIPGIWKTEMCTTCDIENGSVAVLSGQEQMRSSEKVVEVYLIKAEIVEPMQTAKKHNIRSLLE